MTKILHISWGGYDKGFYGNSIWAQYDDFRAHLWLSLPINHRLLLIISEYDKREADLMSLLLFKQYTDQRKTIINLDIKMESTIKNLLYDRYLSLSQQKATEMSIVRIKSFNKHRNEEMINAANFVKFLHSKSDQIHASIQNQKRKMFD